MNTVWNTRVCTIHTCMTTLTVSLMTPVPVHSRLALRLRSTVSSRDASPRVFCHSVIFFLRTKIYLVSWVRDNLRIVTNSHFGGKLLGSPPSLDNLLSLSRSSTDCETSWMTLWAIKLNGYQLEYYKSVSRYYESCIWPRLFKGCVTLSVG